MSKYTTKPEAVPSRAHNKYERYSLRENPFPVNPIINPDSPDDRMNGVIYDPSIRTAEYDKVVSNFIKVPQTEPNHLRLGYIVDTSYIGRGNGKSAFIVNLQKEINRDFALTLSQSQNKCFAVRLRPEGGGSIKTFERFIELFVDELFDSHIIADALVALRLSAILAIDETFDADQHFTTDDDYRDKLSQMEWYRDNRLDYRHINHRILSNEYIQSLPPDFPLFQDNRLFGRVSNESTFRDYFVSLRRGKPKSEFVFSHLVNMFIAAGFNGAYVFVDDFERIPDFQSGRQKRDFATQLRTFVFDGSYTNASIGFYNFILVLHAGVQGMIQEAWELSGLEHRAPLPHQGAANAPSHIIFFNKITTENTYSLIGKYLESYRITKMDESDMLFPFSRETVSRLAEINEYNCTKILKSAYEVLKKAADNNISPITPDMIVADEDDISDDLGNRLTGIHNAPTKNLLDEE
ncbi:hypothetical protein G4Y79_04570 [Phototrophicus methaneseepsis]|uniref:Uncharacterized protein n=1 Tax=Phototrophicus methaneseepsis TaxID=2710758 RepID=A0A7S8EB16_9CHLR|nr:hypothetical protein [Phototrophicus methaneseepsis]QPC83661.1 hypothetical protein G4Y79_04570 [Phototrophicus methaneseepsis]